MVARIYKPARNAMQSGMATCKEWVLEYEREVPEGIEPLMGWISSNDTRSQVRLRFATKEEAVGYATRNGIPFRLELPEKTELRPKSYAENFSFGRIHPWTH